MGDPYEILGLDPDATPKDIHAAKRKLAKKHHPDAVGASDRAEAAEQMVAINWAVAVLLDPLKRAEIDLRRAKAAADSSGPTGASRSAGVRFSTGGNTSSDEPATDESRPRQWRTAPPPADLTIREFEGWGGAHWIYVHAPGGRAGTMNVTTGEVTIEREELREQVLVALQHHAFHRW